MYVFFQSDTTISYYSAYWQQVTVIRPSSDPHYIKFKNRLHVEHINFMSYDIPWVTNCHARRTHAKAEPLQYNGKIRGCSVITKTTIYTEDNRSHKETPYS